MRPGHYFVSSYVVTPDAEGTTKLSDSVTYFARPELKLTGTRPSTSTRATRT